MNLDWPGEEEGHRGRERERWREGGGEERSTK